MARQLLPILLIAIGSVACSEDDGSTDAPARDVGSIDTNADTGTEASDGGMEAADALVDGGEDADQNDLGSDDGGNTGPGIVFRVYDLDGDPIAGATIEFDGASATTDASGAAFVPVVPGEHVFVVRHSGHRTTPFAYQVPASERVQIDATLLDEGPLEVEDDATFAMFGEQGSLGLIAMDALQTEAGADISGNYEARLSNLDPSDLRSVLAAPLPFLGRDAMGAERSLEIFRLFEISVTQNGLPLTVKPGAMAAVDALIPAAFADLVAVGDMVPAWSYDVASGRWTQEMDGMIQQSPFGGGKIWQGFMTHFSWWAVGRPFDEACLETRTSNAAGAPIDGALVRAIGIDHGRVSVGFSNVNGDVCLPIKPGGNVAVSAVQQDYASTSAPIVALGNVVPGTCGDGSCVQVPIALEGAACIGGVVLDRQGAPYSNASVQLKYDNGSGQAVSSFTTSDVDGTYCALGAIDRVATIIASDLAYVDTATASAGVEEAICGQNCGAAPDLILADFVGGCWHGTAEIYQGAGNPRTQAPQGTPIYVYSGADFTPSCAAGQDDPAMWGTLVETSAVGANGAFCVSAIPLGSSLIVLGDCSTWPSEVCGPVTSGGVLMSLAVCGQPGCVDVGMIRYNMVCDGGS